MQKSSKTVFGGLSIWFVLAIAFGFSGRMVTWQPPLPQVLVITLTAGFLAIIFLVPRFREWAGTVSVRALVGWHLTRFLAGAYFLTLSARGMLSSVFAILAGWGDIAVAIAALGLLLTASAQSKSGRLLYTVWNVLGLLDILFVVVSAARVGLSDPPSMRAFLQMPLSLLPTFLVPTIIAGHIILFRRLRA
jgi:hypothetical protein